MGTSGETGSKGMDDREPHDFARYWENTPPAPPSEPRNLRQNPNRRVFGVGVLVAAAAIAIAMVMFFVNRPSGWPDVERQAFLDECNLTRGGLSSYCSCALEQLEREFDVPGDVTTAAILETLGGCF
jgi:hypothetical protein